MNLLCVGSVAYDTIETPFTIKENILGGSATFFSTAASFFTSPAIIGVTGEDFRKEDIEFLVKRNINVRGLKKIAGKTFFWRGRYYDSFKKRESLCTELNVFEKFDPEIPSEMKDYELIFLGNIHPELQLKVLNEMKNKIFVAADTMIYWYENAREKLFEMLKKVNALIINDEEALCISGDDNILKAGKKLLKLGPQIIIIKRGDSGSLMIMEDEIFLAPAYPLEDVMDPTGAGDSFAGGFIGYIAMKGDIKKETMRKAIAMATVVASFCVEGFSPYHLGSITLKEVLKRYNEYKKMCSIFD